MKAIKDRNQRCDLLPEFILCMVCLNHSMGLNVTHHWIQHSYNDNDRHTVDHDINTINTLMKYWYHGAHTMNDTILMLSIRFQNVGAIGTRKPFEVTNFYKLFSHLPIQCAPPIWALLFCLCIWTTSFTLIHYYL